MTRAHGRLARWWPKITGYARAALAIYEELYTAPYRAQIRREYQAERDLLFLAGCSDMLGIPNPVMFYSLELYPELLEQWHDWHRRLGMPQAPEGGFRCC
jgi:hypothetical protein